MSGLSLFGVNLSGAEFGAGGTRGVNFDYTYPSLSEIDYYYSKGFTAIRVPFLLERLQPVAGGAMNASELGYLDTIVNYATSKGIDVILDPHNYGYAYGSQIGSSETSNSNFANFWGQLAGHYSANANVLFGLMNEPTDINPTQWLVAVNEAISAIRASGAISQQILVPGTYWDGADSWVSSGNATIIGNGVTDSANNFAFEVHQYLDSDGSGTHSTVVSPTVGVERLAAVTAWAETTGNKLFLGEFGVASDSTSLLALNNMLSYMEQHSGAWEGGTYWAAGPWWGSYMYSVEPTGGLDKPQMAILSQYVRNPDDVTHAVNTVIETSGIISLVNLGQNYFFHSDAEVFGPTLKFGDANVTVGEFGGDVVPVGVENVATGYEVVWKTAVDQYTIWFLDENGNYVLNLGSGSGISLAIETAETVLHQDINGDGVTGLNWTSIETSGSVTLEFLDSRYYLNSFGRLGPTLKFGASDVTTGEFGESVVPIGVEKIATGYELVWKTALDQYTIWFLDDNGNYVLNLGSGSGTSLAIETAENVLHQDINGDGVTGLNWTSIESSGLVALEFLDDRYYLNSDGRLGPTLKFGDADVTMGKFGEGVVPVGVENIATGYEVVWKNAADQYTVWLTDDNGNYVLNLGSGSGTSLAIEMAENVLHQDINGDGVVGLANQAGSILEMSRPAFDNSTYTDTASTSPLDNKVQIPSSYDTPTGVLDVSKGAGSDYVLPNFNFASNGHNDTVVANPTVSADVSITVATEANSMSVSDLFVVQDGQLPALPFATDDSIMVSV